MSKKQTKKSSVWNKTQQFLIISIQTGFGEIRNNQTQNSKCPSMRFHRPSTLRQHKESVFHSADTRQNKRNDRNKCYVGGDQKQSLGVYCKPFHLHSLGKKQTNKTTLHRSFKWFKVSSVPLTNSRTSGRSIYTSTASSLTTTNGMYACVCMCIS